MSISSYFTSYIHSAVQASSTMVNHYGLSVVILILFFESMGVIFLPGETILIASGFLAGQGLFSPALLWILAVIGTGLGWFGSYYIGEKFGIRWVKKHGKWIGINESRLAKAHSFLTKYGAVVILFGRFVVPLRQLQGYISGSADITFRQFYPYNIIGAMLWVSFWGGAGYFLGML